MVVRICMYEYFLKDFSDMLSMVLFDFHRNNFGARNDFSDGLGSPDNLKNEYSLDYEDGQVGLLEVTGW